MQSSFKEVKESMKGGQHDLRMESFEYLFRTIMVFKIPAFCDLHFFLSP